MKRYLNRKSSNTYICIDIFSNNTELNIYTYTLSGVNPDEIWGRLAVPSQNSALKKVALLQNQISQKWAFHKINSLKMPPLQNYIA